MFLPFYCMCVLELIALIKHTIIQNSTDITFCRVLLYTIQYNFIIHLYLFCSLINIKTYHTTTAQMQYWFPVSVRSWITFTTVVNQSKWEITLAWHGCYYLSKFVLTTSVVCLQWAICTSKSAIATSWSFFRTMCIAQSYNWTSHNITITSLLV